MELINQEVIKRGTKISFLLIGSMFSIMGAFSVYRGISLKQLDYLIIGILFVVLGVRTLKRYKKK